jgi:hypothetical protein
MRCLLSLTTYPSLLVEQPLCAESKRYQLHQRIATPLTILILKLLKQLVSLFFSFKIMFALIIVLTF